MDNHKNTNDQRDPTCSRNVQFSREEFRQLRAAAEAAGTTRSAVIRAAAQGLIAALAEQRASGSPTPPIDRRPSRNPRLAR